MANRTTFKPGTSGNPAGRVKGTRNAVSVAMEALLDDEGEAITRIAIEKAKEGDTVALRLVLDRLIPPRRERSISFTLPSIETPADAVKAAAAIVAGVGSGDLLLSEAAELMRLVENVAKTIATSDHAERIARLEEALPR